MAFARDTLGITDAPFEAQDLVERAGEVLVCPFSPHLCSLSLLLPLPLFNAQFEVFIITITHADSTLRLTLMAT
jgi:hypothetical protein